MYSGTKVVPRFDIMTCKNEMSSQWKLQKRSVFDFSGQALNYYEKLGKENMKLKTGQ